MLCQLKPGHRGMPWVAARRRELCTGRRETLRRAALKPCRFNPRRMSAPHTTRARHLVRGLDISCKTRGVHQRRGFHLFAQRGAECGKARHVRGESGGDAHVVVFVVRDQIGKTRGVQQAHADARCVRFSGEGDHRHAHPERLASGRRAVVGVRVERDVEPVVEREMFCVVSLECAQFDPSWRDAVGFKSAQDPRARFLAAERASMGSVLPVDSCRLRESPSPGCCRPSAIASGTVTTADWSAASCTILSMPAGTLPRDCAQSAVHQAAANSSPGRAASREVP